MALRLSRRCGQQGNLPRGRLGEPPVLGWAPGTRTGCPYKPGPALYLPRSKLAAASASSLLTPNSTIMYIHTGYLGERAGGRTPATYGCGGGGCWAAVWSVPLSLQNCRLARLKLFLCCLPCVGFWNTTNTNVHHLSWRRTRFHCLPWTARARAGGRQDSISVAFNLPGEVENHENLRGHPPEVARQHHHHTSPSLSRLGVASRAEHPADRPPKCPSAEASLQAPAPCGTQLCPIGVAR